MALAFEAQGSGLGRVMLESAERAAVEVGYRLIKLYERTMTENVALHTRTGYARTHRVEEKRVAVGLHAQAAAQNVPRYTVDAPLNHSRTLVRAS